jgi:hypothetical protein
VPSPARRLGPFALVVLAAAGAPACGARKAIRLVPEADAGGCRRQEHDLRRFPAELLVLLDRSSSMSRPADRGGSTLWQEVTGALDETIARSQGLVRWSLKLFPTVFGCAVSDGVEVSADDGDAEQVRAALRAASPAVQRGGTPAQAAVRAATAYLSRRRTEKLQYMMLATDGAPTCRDQGPMGGDTEGTVEALRDAARKGLPTFVVGIAIEGSQQHAALNDMADAGGQPRGGSTRYFSALNRREVEAALAPIVSYVSCSLPLPARAAPEDPVAVTIDDEPVPESPAEGWTLNDSRGAVSLTGSWCAKIRERQAQKITVSVACE